VGLLELGEHSAALLKVNGVTQRIMIGENLPDSNWKLTKISSDKATFQKGSQQKFMSVGESMSQK
jgi:Tfp pilus assembly protein PilP